MNCIMKCIVLSLCLSGSAFSASSKPKPKFLTTAYKKLNITPVESDKLFEAMSQALENLKMNGKNYHTLTTAVMAGLPVIHPYLERDKIEQETAQHFAQFFSLKEHTIDNLVFGYLRFLLVKARPKKVRVFSDVRTSDELALRQYKGKSFDDCPFDDDSFSDEDSFSDQE
ncbi:hypothetical protein K2X40_02200 [Candidatus Babeliales bacterium]|nr:hypothetical protein [Candidatus Babeliales bacterium]